SVQRNAPARTPLRERLQALDRRPSLRTRRCRSCCWKVAAIIAAAAQKVNVVLILMLTGAAPLWGNSHRFESRRRVPPAIDANAQKCSVGKNSLPAFAAPARPCRQQLQ